MVLGKRKTLRQNLINTLLATIVIGIVYICYTIIYDLRVHFVNRSELKDIAGINQVYSDKFERFVADIEQKTEWKAIIISGFRTKNEQIKLKRNNPRNASFNKSRHVMGRAVDINLYKRKGLGIVWLKKSNSKAEWQMTGVPAIAKTYHLLWGGTYHTYHDPVHFEIN